MGVLVLRYQTNQEQVSLSWEWRPAGQSAQLGSRYESLCSSDAVRDLSRQMHTLLSDMVWVAASGASPQDLESRLLKLRDRAETLRQCLLPEALVRWMESAPGLDHVIFQCPWEFSEVPLEWMALGGEFLAYRYATGKELVGTAQRAPTPNRGTPSAGEDRNAPYRTFSVVDPEGLLEQAGARHLRTRWERFRQVWASAQPARGPASLPLRPQQMIEFRDVRAFRPVRKEALAEAFRQREMVLLMGHYVARPTQDGPSGFILGRNELFTNQDLRQSFQGSTSPPLLVVAIACESGRVQGDSAGEANALSGMIQEMIEAGVPHYVGAVVRIPADLSAELVEPFFRGLIEGRTVGEALRLARLAFRRRPSDPLDSGTAMGLSFLLYGDPTIGYFCSCGHRVDRVPQQRCEAMTDSGRPCGRIICSQETDGFARFRCAIHTGAKRRCSAGHEVDDHAQMVSCRKCRNLICPACRGFGQELCWEHCCYEGHPIQDQARKDCPDPFGLHPNERRSVCPQDIGWLRGLCRDCFQKLQKEPLESCPHSGDFIQAGNPWSNVRCDSCGQLLCKRCEPWYLATGYCLNCRIADGIRDVRWLESLDRRSQQDGRTASLKRLEECGSLAKWFQDRMAANLAEQVRRSSPLPRLSRSLWSIFLPEPRCWGGLHRDAADLSEWLTAELEKQWDLDRLDPPWRPPSSWRSAYGISEGGGNGQGTRGVQAGSVSANQLRVHSVHPLWGRPVLVAVAAVTPVEFQKSGRGPVLIPAGRSHVHQIEGVLKRWWMQSHGDQAALPDTYLVVLSTTGWAPEGGQPGCAENYTQLAPGWLTVAAEPQGTNQVRVAPPRAGLPERIVNFLPCFSPYSRSQLLTDICREIEKALQVRSFVTVADLQEELETSEAFRAIPIHPQWILEAFLYLAKTANFERYLPFSR
jgi:hypothetical protein